MWENRFQRKILDRGYAYYAKGNVSIYKEWEDESVCFVESDSSPTEYEVTIFFDDKRGSADMLCDCPYAMDGNNCKHMAAVMYKLSKSSRYTHSVFYENYRGRAKARAQQQMEKYVPLFEEEDSEYQYYDLKKITEELLFTEDVVKSAKDDAKRNIVTLDRVYTDYKNGYFMSEILNCKVKGSVHTSRGYLYDVNLAFDNKHFSKMVCNVPGCECRYDEDYYFYGFNAKKRPCEHVSALMLLLREYQKEHVLGDATDSSGMKMLNLFRNMNVQKQVAEGSIEQLVGKVDIEPRLILDEDEIHLSFKIGMDKMYVMKSIKDFYAKYSENDSLKLGKNTNINLATAQYTKRAESYIDFISREVKQELVHKERLEQNSRSWYAPEVKAEGMSGYLDMYGIRLDDFFDKEFGNTITFNDKAKDRKDKSITLIEKGLKISLSLDANLNGAELESIQVYGEFPLLFEGLKYQYFIEGNNLCRLDEESKKNLEPLRSLESDGVINFLIGRNNIAEFYYKVLPELEKCADIQNNVGDLVEEFLPRDMDVIYYLDAEKEYLVCRPVARYENEKLAMTDMLFPDAIKDHTRNKLKEQEALAVAQMYFPQVDGEILICENDEDEVYRLLDVGLSQLMHFGEVQCTDRFKSRNVKKTVKVSVGVSVQSSIMDLEISSDDVSPQELLEILESYRLKKKYHRLKNGEFIDITDDSIKELSAMMDSMHINAKEFVTGKMHLPLYRALYLDKMLESCQEIYTSRDSYFRNLVKGFKTIGDSDYEVPEALNKTLRNYQKYGFKWMKVLENNNFCGILADDMGLGKTLQMISVLSADEDRVDEQDAGGKNTSLIVSPASLVYNWQEEFSRFAPNMKVGVVAGKAEDRKKVIDSYKSYDAIITSYDLLKRDIAEYDGKEFYYQIIDEAQYIKTHTTAAAKSVKLIKSAHKMALTGTPIENRLSELWSIFDYLMPGFLYNYETFRKEIETPIVKQKDEEATKRLKRMVSPFILRRLKGDVLKDLPDKMEELQYAHMEEKQQQLYDAQVTHMKEVLKGQDEESFKKNKIQILAELTRIRQICCDPSLMVENYKGESAKKEACMELIERAIEGEHKMLIFSQFTSMLDILSEELRSRNIAFYTITGATPKEKRLEYVKAFNADDVPVFLISLKAGGTGLNLTGADMVIHYDPWWNVAAQNQATDRAHRIGQTKVVTVYKLIVKGSIEEKIVKMQQDKADLANEILSGENGNIVNMTREDLLELL